MSTGNVASLPTPPKRCEYPNCLVRGSDVSYVKTFNRHLCTEHKQYMLQAHSFVLQVEDENRRAKGDAGLLERIENLSQNKKTVVMVDKKLMDEIRGRLVDQMAEIEMLKKRLELKDNG